MKSEMHYQVIGSEWLAERDNAMLADEPGLGKSVQAIRACDLVFAVNVLIIAPASVVSNWHNEIAMWRIGDWTYLVVSYEGASGRYRDQIFCQRWSVVIVDEAQMLRSIGIKRTKTIYGDVVGILREFDGIIHLADRVWLLSGTPQMNWPIDYYSHFKALASERIRSKKSGKIWSFEQFQSYFCQLQPAFAGMKIVGSRNETELAKRLDGFMLRRLKKDVLPDLPDVRFSEFDIAADMTDIDLGIDPAEAAELKALLERDGVAGLKRAYTHFASLRRVTGLAKVKPIAEYLRMFMETTDRKIVVFAQHTDVLYALRQQKGMERFVHITGSTMPLGRKNAVERFQNDPLIRGFFGQIQAAGTGITLTAASDLLFVEASWVPADNAQAAMRIHRIGQKSLCDVRYAVLPGSIDAIIARAVMRKSESIAKVMGEET
jgi:SWI/SNF-related matrix-associated actin-dependent regulator 1 of chromatin subfamily A